MFIFLNLIFNFLLLRAAPVAHGRSQDRGQIRAAAATLHHSSWQQELLMFIDFTQQELLMFIDFTQSLSNDELGIFIFYFFHIYIYFFFYCIAWECFKTSPSP